MIERFMKKVSVQNGCWPWLACKTKDGYGQFNNGTRMEGAHRVSFKLFKGPVLNGLYVLHSCDNPSCVNPDHLFLGTQDDNMKDMAIKKRSGRGGGRPCRFSAEVLEFIRQSNLTQDRLGRMFGMSQTNVSRIKRSC